MRAEKNEGGGNGAEGRCLNALSFIFAHKCTRFSSLLLSPAERVCGQRKDSLRKKGYRGSYLARSRWKMGAPWKELSPAETAMAATHSQRLSRNHRAACRRHLLRQKMKIPHGEYQLQKRQPAWVRSNNARGEGKRDPKGGGGEGERRGSATAQGIMQRCGS